MNSTVSVDLIECDFDHFAARAGTLFYTHVGVQYPVHISPSAVDICSVNSELISVFGYNFDHNSASGYRYTLPIHTEFQQKKIYG